MRTKPVTDNISYKEAVLEPCLIKREDLEESIEEKNAYGMSGHKELIISNMKEEEEGRERKSGEVKSEREQETEGDEIISESKVTERLLCEEGIEDGEKQEEEGSSPLDASCPLKQPGVALLRSAVSSSFKGKSEVFACSRCPFIHTEEGKLHQHIQKVHPKGLSRILGFVGSGAENPQPPSSSHQHFILPDVNYPANCMVLTDIIVLPKLLLPLFTFCSLTERLVDSREIVRADIKSEFELHWKGFMPSISGRRHEEKTCDERVPLIESSVTSFINGYSGESEEFVCPQCPFSHMEEEKLHPDCEKVHPSEQSRILGYGGVPWTGTISVWVSYATDRGEPPERLQSSGPEASGNGGTEHCFDPRSEKGIDAS
ncbi:hypothetical protein GJAV_G00072010 [Gymnothorax javanicus]|nr:hypothetical protein GJAV_G00072010 [Gymnothorax javanicus]